MTKHFHVYFAGARDRKRGPPRFYASSGIGYWSRSDANAAKKGKDAIVRVCDRDDCPMKQKYQDR